MPQVGHWPVAATWPLMLMPAGMRFGPDVCDCEYLTSLDVSSLSLKSCAQADTPSSRQKNGTVSRGFRAAMLVSALRRMALRILFSSWGRKVVDVNCRMTKREGPGPVRECDAGEGALSKT
jgi:hypothetical protein